MQIRVLGAALAALAATGFLPAQSAPCYDPDFGTLVGTGDDVLFTGNNLGFAFPYGGTTYTQVDIATNGFVYLGSAGTSTRCCASSSSQFLGDPPSIAVLWTDLVVDAPGGVYFKAVPGRAVVTWHRAIEYGYGTQFTLQLQLMSDGSIAMWFHPATTIVDSYHTCLCGVTPGNGAADPGPIDISASLPYNSNTQPTIYEEWTAPAFDLAGTALGFLPNGSNGYVVVNRGCPFTAGTTAPVGRGCPPLQLPDAEFYEEFAAGTVDLANTAIEMIPLGNTGYVVQPSNATLVTPTNALAIGDDQVIVQALPFTFTHPGGSITSVGQCSNGYLWLDNGASSAASYFPFVPDLLQQGPRFCPLWLDLDPSSGGTVYYDTTPTSALFTWVQVPLYASPVDLVTFQVQLHSDGRIVVVYQSLSVIADCIAGYSRGGGVADPGSIDLSANLPFPTGTGTAVHPARLEGVNSPVVGSTCTLRAFDLPASTTAGFLVLGLVPISVDLSGLGMTNCTQYETIDSSSFFVAAAPSATQSFNIPNSPSFVGFLLRAQFAVLAAGVNPLGIVTTNAGAITVGTF